MPSGKDDALALIIGGPPDTPTLAETVAERLRELIITGQLPPGAELRLAPLAKQLGVSIMPVREAIRLLESERLVVVRPRRRAVVADLSIEDIEETYAVRVALEGLAARHAAERLTASDLAEIELRFAEMVKARDEGDFEMFIDADRDFHMRLYATSGRDRLVQRITDLERQSRRYASYVYASWQPLDIALRAHQPLLDAIESGDPALVEHRTTEHMSSAAARLLAAVRREEEGRTK